MKIGDEIECVKLDSGLVLGKKYKVFDYSPTWCEEKRPVIKVQKNGSPYYADHFKLIKELSNIETINMKIGDKIVCKQDSGSNSLQLNKEYIIVQINSHGNIGLQENFGGKFLLPHFYKRERFTLVREKTKKIDSSKDIDLSKTYKTRDGREVNLFCYSNSPDYPVVGEFKNSTGWENGSWTLKGSFLSDTTDDDLDLIEQVMEKTLNVGRTSVKVYKDQSIYIRDANITWDKEDMKELVEVWNSFNEKAS